MNRPLDEEPAALVQLSQWGRNATSIVEPMFYLLIDGPVFRRSRQNWLSSNYLPFCAPQPFLSFYLFILKAALHRRRRCLAGAFNNRLVCLAPAGWGRAQRKRQGGWGVGARAGGAGGVERGREKSIYGRSSHQPLISV